MARRSTPIEETKRLGHFDPLFTSRASISTVIALQFVPVLAAVTIMATFTWQRTGSHRAGGLITGLLVTLYAVAGTATQG